MSAAGNLNANKILRPYDGLDAFEDLFENLEFRIRGRLEWISENDLIFQIEEYSKPGVQVRFDTLDSNWEQSLKLGLAETSLKSSELELFGVLRTPGTKQVKEVFRKGLSDLGKTKGEIIFDLIFDNDVSLSPSQDSTLEIYLVLAKESPNKFPLPYLKGTWLSQKIINLRCEKKGSIDFEWLPLDEEERTERGLHKNSLHYVENVYPLHEGESLGDCIKAFLDPAFKSRLETMENSAMQKFLQATLVVEVIDSSLTFTVEKLRRENGSFPLWAEIENQGMFSRILKAFAAKGTFSGQKMDPEGIYGSITSKPETIREYVEDFFKLRNLSLAVESSSEEN
jgi:hypothetical protein